MVQMLALFLFLSYNQNMWYWVNVNHMQYIINELRLAVALCPTLISVTLKDCQDPISSMTPLSQLIPVHYNTEVDHYINN